MKKLLAGISLIAASSLIGCGNNTVSKNIQQSVTDNQNAQSLMEWEQSKANPEILFANWRKDFMVDSSQREKLQKDICEELANLDALSLTIFENEIRDQNNRALIIPCKGELISKLESHYIKERSTMQVAVNATKTWASGNNFQFPSNVQKRDTSNGYFAVTGDVARKEVVLTFDDGPSGEYTESILRSLKEVNAKVIFFHMGKNVRLNPDVVKKVAADGHSIGSHSITHACLGTSNNCRKTNGRVFTFDEAVAEIKGGHQAVYDVLGWVDPFFRFPYGESSNELKNYLKMNSTGEFYWSIDSEDWKAQTNENMLKNTLAQLDARGRGIVLFHDIQRKTAEVLPQFLREIYNRGYSVVLLQPADLSVRYNSKLVRKPQP